MRKVMMTSAALLALFAAGDALALGPSFGIRIATGSGFDRDDKLGQDASIFPFAIGPAVKFTLPMLELELNALYWSTTLEGSSGAETVDNELALPLIARVMLPVVPLLLDLGLGIGLEPRFHLSTTVDGKDFDSEDRQMVMYLPLSVAGDLNLGVANLNVEIRYEYQLTERSEGDKTKIDYLTFFGGVFF
ncbi:MAG: hypothetical protein ACI9U2_002987 [Bradymonadia bacterium]|jgi:hypothetical protein